MTLLAVFLLWTFGWGQSVMKSTKLIEHKSDPNHVNAIKLENDVANDEIAHGWPRQDISDENAELFDLHYYTV